MKKIVFSLTFILILVMTFNLRNESFAISADILSEIHLESKNPPAPPPEPDHSGGGGGYNPEYNNDTDKNEEEDEEQDDDGDDENGDGENGEKEEIPADTWETIQHPEVYNAGFSGRIYEDAKHLDSATGIEIVDGTYRIPVDAKITIGRKESWGDSYSLSLSDEFPAGTYTITVEYGVPNPILKGNTGYIKRQLRYNAQDFYINERQGIRKFVNSYVRDIQISGKGCIQMMLVIDASGSMTDTDNLVDGRHTRLEKQIDAAKTLVNNLLTDKNENLYIGIVAFAYESNLIQPLTYKRDKVIDSLNKLSESAKNPENYSGGTNIYGAIDQANNSFVYSGEDSNRMMVLLSDGLPIFTGTDIDEPYYEEDLEDGEAERKLNNVKAKTEEKMQEVRSSGVNLSAIIVETNDPWENGRIVDLCKNGCGEENYSVVTDDDAISRIEDGIKDSVIESQLENIDFEKTEEYYQKMFESPYNNSSYFNTFTNDNTKIFDVINNYDGTDVAFQDALKLSEKTKGSVSFTYTLDNKPDQRVYAKDVKSYDEFSEEQRKYNHTLHGEHPEDA